MISTVSDAVGAFKVLYKGSDPHLITKLEWWCQQLGPSTLLESITPDAIDDGLRVLMEAPANTYKRGIGVVPANKQRANGTVNKYLAALASLYKLLKLHRRLPRSFVSPIVRGQMLPLPPGKTLQCSIEDVRRLVDAARLTRNRKLPALIAVAATTGLRKGNLQALAWGNVDLKNRTIDVLVTKNRAPVRSIVPTWAAAELARIKPDSPAPTMPVFDKKEFKKSLATALDAAGLPSTWTFHSLRHVAASILAQSGASLVEIMGVLNHKSPLMAMRYSHLNTKTIAEAVSRAWD